MVYQRGSDQAYPQPHAAKTYEDGSTLVGQAGMTIREVFAKAAPPASDRWLNTYDALHPQQGLSDAECLRAEAAAHAAWATCYADALLAALDGKQKP